MTERKWSLRFCCLGFFSSPHTFKYQNLLQKNNSLFQRTPQRLGEMVSVFREQEGTHLRGKKQVWDSSVWKRNIPQPRSVEPDQTLESTDGDCPFVQQEELLAARKASMSQVWKDSNPKVLSVIRFRPVKILGDGVLGSVYLWEFKGWPTRV